MDVAVTPVIHRLSGNGVIPNNPHCPVVYYPRVVTLPARDPAHAFETLFSENDWPAAWRNGIFSYHHFHSNAHEVLGIYRGSASVQLGGELGIVVEVRPGDVVVIPAGVGHKKLSSDGRLGVVGAYPSGQSPDLCRPDAALYGRRLEAVAAVPRPRADPVTGIAGALTSLWS